MTAKKIPAVVLAGAPATKEAAEKYGITSMAALPLGGKPMYERVVEALRGSPAVGNIHIVGNVECSEADSVIKPGGSLLENLITGVNACGSVERVLISTSDIPLVTSEGVSDFIERCSGEDAEFCYAIVKKDTIEIKYPGMRRTYIRLREGTFTGGNMFVVSSRFITENPEVIKEAYKARKEIFKLARIIGLGVVIKAVIAHLIWPGALDLAQLEKAAGRVLKAKLKAIPTPFPEIGADLDDIEQLEKFQEFLNATV